MLSRLKKLFEKRKWIVYCETCKKLIDKNLPNKTSARAFTELHQKHTDNHEIYIGKEVRNEQA